MNPPSPLLSPATCQMIGHSIKLEKRLGMGSSGEVWSAVVTNPSDVQASIKGGLPSSFALKLIRGQHLCTPRQQALVQQEILSLKLLQHPHINTYIASWVERSENAAFDGCMCIATQYCAGGDLLQQIQKRKPHGHAFSQETVMLVAAQLLSACAYAHANKVLHRDIKPGNIFVKSADGITLGDFGLSHELDHTLDVASSRVGTADYCSPQVAAGRTYTGKTDVWSVGVVLFEMMTLQRPFSNAKCTNERVFERIMEDDPIPSLRSLCGARYSNTVLNIVDAALSKREEDRPSALELLTTFSNTFAAFVKQSGVPVPAPVQRRSSPVRKVQTPLPERTPSPLRRGGDAALRQRPPSPMRDGASRRITAATAASPITDDNITSQSIHQVSVMVSSLLQGKPHPHVEATPAAILKALHNDDELFLLTKVLLLTRQGKDRAHIEDGLFKLLVALRPEVDADKVIHLLLSHLPKTVDG